VAACRTITDAQWREAGVVSQLPDPSKAVLVAVLVPLIYHGLVAAFSLLGKAAMPRRAARVPLPAREAGTARPQPPWREAAPIGHAVVLPFAAEKRRAKPPPLG
jgi:hypothetical protein